MDEIEHQKSMRKTFVVYEPSSGKIIHIHEALAVPEVALPDENELESEARNIAHKDTGLSTSGLAVMKINREDMKPDTYYEVDSKNKVLLPKGKIEFEKKG
jgi:hypothetical protein